MKKVFFHTVLVFAKTDSNIGTYTIEKFSSNNSGIDKIHLKGDFLMAVL